MRKRWRDATMALLANMSYEELRDVQDRAILEIENSVREHNEQTHRLLFIAVSDALNSMVNAS